MLESNPTTFKDFLLEEYRNIAQAHFKSIETISTFFRYYVLIMSLPLSAIAIIISRTPNSDDFLRIIDWYRLPISIIFGAISLIGFGLFCYVVNLRLDAILYARTVNGIRKFFFDTSRVDLNLKARHRVLPQTPQLPPYYEKSFFLPVVFVFGLFDLLYSSASYLIYMKNSFYLWLFVSFIMSFGLLHWLIYLGYANHRETAYLKSNIIGIDIDGVLNKHREHFCSLLKIKQDKEIDPQEIITIPVREDYRLDISKEQEWSVYNDPEYWTEMPVIEDAAAKIRSLKNIFRFKILFFTYRPWPEDENKKIKIVLRKKFLIRCCGKRSKFCVFKTWMFFRRNPLKKITIDWLRKHDFSYNKLYFEKGNDYTSDPRASFKNRFWISRKRKVRIFIEDDLEKAIKLAFICDVVFLLSHPYNEPREYLPPEERNRREKLPSNIVRIKNWTEIYQTIRRLA